LRLTYNPQNAARFIRPIFTRDKGGSRRDHVLRRLHRNVCAVAAINRFEHGYDDVDVVVMVRIISHAVTACAHGYVTATAPLSANEQSGHCCSIDTPPPRP